MSKQEADGPETWPSSVAIIPGAVPASGCMTNFTGYAAEGGTVHRLGISG